jgi:predicted ATPase
MAEQPSGTVTFLFTDIEGSTRLLHELGPERYREALAAHRRVLREAFDRHEGYEVDYEGDAFFVAFASPQHAVAAAAEAQEALLGGPISVRMGLHTGQPILDPPKYVGVDVHRAARIMSAGHGGQVLLSHATRALLGEHALRDLGLHRLKDLLEPERLYQLGEQPFPPLKTLYRANLPIQPTEFLGRVRELAEVGALLAETRLLTLTGVGGTGKTRLALQAAAEAADEYPDGVWWVPLAPLREPELVLETLSQTLDAKGELREHIGDKRTVVVLDNFEQVIEAAPAVADLLTDCLNLKLLITSRETLRVRAERQYPVPPLADEEAVGLFNDRARAGNPDFRPSEAVAEICARLDNLPLAVELAAARTNALSSEQIRDRLSQRLDLLKGGRDADPRQQTLRAAIQWSHDLLDAAEKRLFARLSVFVGGCSLESAEQVCAADLDTVESLLDQSLLRRSDDRYAMLETVREYAVERLEQSDEAEDVRRRHAGFFLELAERAKPSLDRGSEQGAWLDRLEQERDNIRAALALWVAQGEGNSLLRMTAAIWRFWRIRGYQSEGRRWLDEALRSTSADMPERLDALEGASYLAYQEQDQEAVLRMGEEFVDAARRAGDRLKTGIACHILALPAGSSGDWERAETLEEESLALCAGDAFARWPANGLGVIAFIGGDVERARTLLSQALELFQLAGDRWGTADALSLLGVATLQQGDEPQASELLRQSLELSAELRDRQRIAMRALPGIAALLARRSRPRRAATLLGLADAMLDELDASLGPIGQLLREQALEALGMQINEAELASATEDGRRLLREAPLEDIVADILRDL